MGSPWHNFPPNFGNYQGYYTNAQNIQPFPPGPSYYDVNTPLHPQILTHLNTAFPEYDELSRAILPAQGSNKIRRRVNAGGEHVKFRRTRSGCYTCRNRRVKCDETRPTCERCRKGNRECVYPEPPSAKARRDSNRSRSGREGDTSSPDDGDLDSLIADDEDAPRSAVDEPDSATSVTAHTPEQRAVSDPPVLSHGSSPTPSTEGSSTLGRAKTSTPTSHTHITTTRPRQLSGRSIQDLPQDIRFYLQYARTKMTHHHWGIRVDHQNFLLKTMIEVALRYDPLLYAIVGFAAYHYTISQPDGKLEDFLGYYQQSVKLLRQGFKHRPTIATILTILQLATIEEFLGDWVNLMSHQKAALTLITELYTPHKMVAHESLRKILQWYTRFDIFVGILSGSATQMGREWFAIQAEYFHQQCKEHPEVLAWKYEEKFSWIRLTGFDMRGLRARRAANTISEDEFLHRMDEYDNKIQILIHDLDPGMKDPSKLIPDISEGRTKDADDIVDPYEPNLLHGGELFTTNVIIHDLLGFALLHHNQMGALSGKLDYVKMRNLTLRACQLYEAMMLCPERPAGIVFGIQAGLALSVLFLRNDEKEIWWARRKIAEIEANGYTYPVSFRARLEGLWGVDLSEWWLPNDKGRPPLVKQIRDFVQSKPSGEMEQSLYKMEGIFKSLNLSKMDSIFKSLDLSDTSSPESLANNSPVIVNQPVLPRTVSALSTKSEAPSVHSDCTPFDFDMMAAHDRNLALGESPKFEWT